MRDSSSRRPGLDLARNLAIFLVIVQHIVFLGGLTNDGMGELHRLQARLLEALSQSCVDLFGLISGYLGVSACGWKVRKFARLWFQVWTTGLLVLGGCALAALAFPAVFPEGLPTRADWFTAACPLLRDEYWYFTGYLFVFLLGPLINRGLFAAGRERIGLTVAAVLFVVVCGTTVCPGGVTWLPLAKGYSAAWLVCLYVFGAALRITESRWGAIRARWFFAATAACVAATVLQRLSMASVPAIKTFFADEWTLHHYTSPTVTLGAVGLLLGCARLPLTACRGRLARISTALAPCAFGVYLLHVQPFFFRHVIAGRFAFLDRVPDAFFAIAVLFTTAAAHLLFALGDAATRRVILSGISFSRFARRMPCPGSSSCARCSCKAVSPSLR